MRVTKCGVTQGAFEYLVKTTRDGSNTWKGNVKCIEKARDDVTTTIRNDFGMGDDLMVVEDLTKIGK